MNEQTLTSHMDVHVMNADEQQDLSYETNISYRQSVKRNYVQSRER